MKYKEYRKLTAKEIMIKIMESGTTKNWWDYVTALRGPDDADLYYLKELFTCFLRGRKEEGNSFSSSTGSLGIDSFENLIFSIFSPDGSLSLARGGLVLKQMNAQTSYHWINHMREALYVIKMAFGGEVGEVAELLAQILPDYKGRNKIDPTSAFAIAKAINEIHKII